jgi:hypothetical protein
MNLHSSTDNARDVYTGREWSEMDLFDLRWFSRDRRSVAVIAKILCRSSGEVSEKLSELEPETDRVARA